MIEKVRQYLQKFRYRDAVTGRYVSRFYALRHPKTTVREQEHARQTRP